MKRNYYVKSKDTGRVYQSNNMDWGDRYDVLGKAQGARLHKEQCLNSLRESLKPGDTVYTVLRHVSRSGMYRVIDLYKLKESGPEWLSGLAKGAGIGEEPRGRHEGVGVGGCGMDMGFELVYRLGYALWPNGTESPHGTRNGEPDSDGGYALKQRWM
jgi:hypothetical protein